MAMQLDLSIMTSNNVTQYVRNAFKLASDVSSCRQDLQLLKMEYSSCQDNNSTLDKSVNALLLPSSCKIRNDICLRKHIFFQTGDIDFGGDRGERNSVTIEWEKFLKRIVLSNTL